MNFDGMKDEKMSDNEEVKRADNSNSKDNSASFNNDLFLSDEDAMVGNEFTGKFSHHFIYD